MKEDATHYEAGREAEDWPDAWAVRPPARSAPADQPLPELPPPEAPVALLPAPGDTTAPAVHDPSIPQLLKDLMQELTALFTAEVALAKSELRETVDEAKKGAVQIGAGAYLVVLASFALVAAAILGLAEVVAPWLAATIVGAVLLVAGALVLRMGQGTTDDLDLTPERTLDHLERDKRILARGLSERAP